MKIRRAYIDEQALPALLRKDDPIGLDELQTLIPFLGPQGLALLDRILEAARRLHKITSENGGRVARLYTRSPGGGQFKDGIDLFRFMRITKSDARYALYFDLLFLVDCPQSELYQKGINLNALNWLTAAVGERLAWVQVDLRHPSRQISFRKLSRCRLPDLLPLTVLDATTCGEELRALFQREFDLLDVHVNWEGRRTWIRQSMGKVMMSKLSDEMLEKYLKIAADQLPSGCGRALLVTHMAVEQKALEIIGRLRPDVQWESTHYFASRGLNEFESCTAVVCFGVPIMNPEATNDSAAYLFPEDPEQQAEWIRGQSESELYQCAHRGRFVRNPGRALIVMGQSWPDHLLGWPDQTFDRRRNGSPHGASERINEAADRAIPFLDKLGFFTKEVSAWIGIGQADRREKVSQAREALKELRLDLERSGLSQVYQLLYSILIGVDTPELDNLVLFGRRNSWTELLEELERRRPGVGRLSVKLPNWGNRNWTYALGTVPAAREWENGLAACLRGLGYSGSDFNEGSWREGWTGKEGRH